MLTRHAGLLLAIALAAAGCPPADPLEFPETIEMARAAEADGDFARARALYADVAEDHRKNQELEQAIELQSKVVELDGTAGLDATTEAADREILAELYLTSRNRAATESQLREVARLREAARDPAAAALTLNVLGRFRLESQDYADARACFERALALSTQLQDKHAMAMNQLLLAQVHWRRRELEPARARVEQARALARENGNADMEAGAATMLQSMAVEADPDGKEAQAAPARARAAEEAGDIRTARSLHASLARVHEQRRDFAQFVASRRKVLELDQQDRDHPRLPHNSRDAEVIRRVVALDHVLLADAHRLNGDLGAAEPLLGEALRLAEELHDAEVTALALSSLGRLHVQKQDDTQARPRFELALALFTRTQDKSEMAKAHGALARISQRAGDIAQARAHAEQALTLARAAGEPDLQAEAEALLQGLGAAGG